MKKIYRVEIEINKEIGEDHCVYVGNDYKKAVKEYSFNKRFYGEIILYSYNSEEEFEHGDFKEIYYYNKDKRN